MKKKSFTAKLVIVLVALAVIFLALSVASAAYSVDRTVSAIEKIGTVDYTEESLALIEAAQTAYEELDQNLDLQSRITNLDALTQAKAEYVRLAIKKMYLAFQEEEIEDTAYDYITDARAAFDAWFTEEDAGLISNYQDLTEAETAYGTGSGGSGTETPVQQESEEDLELC